MTLPAQPEFPEIGAEMGRVHRRHADVEAPAQLAEMGMNQLLVGLGLHHREMGDAAGRLGRLEGPRMRLVGEASALIMFAQFLHLSLRRFFRGSTPYIQR